jgi:hypothetical protein
MLYGPVTTMMLDPVTLIASERAPSRGIRPEPVRQPSRPATVLLRQPVLTDRQWRKKLLQQNLGRVDSYESREVPPPESAAAVVPGHGRLDPRERRGARR